MPGRRIVVVGAAALRWHFPSFRATLDLDVCIAIDRLELDRADRLPSEWSRHSTLPHRWTTPTNEIVDVLPAAPDLLDTGKVSWPDGTTLDLTGIDLAMRDNTTYSDQLPPDVRVATRRALFLTKVAAFLDRPHERQKDLGDLALLIDRYVEDDDPRCFDAPELRRAADHGHDIEWDLRPAFLLGADLRAVCTRRHTARLRTFSDQVRDPQHREHHWLRQSAPASWQSDPAALSDRMNALTSGFDGFSNHGRS